MRALFYMGDNRWSGSARAFFVAARGLLARGHQVTVACCGGSRLEHRAHDANIETVLINAPESTTGSAWDLRRVLRERFVEVVFVHSERDQLIVSSAMRLAERGGVIRRVPAFNGLELQRIGKIALRIASAGLLVSTERELRDIDGAGWAIPPAVAPLGVDVAAYESVRPFAVGELGIRSNALIIGCIYDPSGRHRIANVFRTMALLAPRHGNLHVIVVGPGALDEELRLHAAALGVSPVVTFLGQRDDELAVLRAASAGWIVASGDGGAFGCLDTMALRLPVIAERSRLTAHYVADGISGVLLEPGDASNTASAVAAFLGHDETRTAMGNAARTRVQRDFPETAMIDGFERAGLGASDRTTWAGAAR